MIALITGAPGTGKTSLLVSLLVDLLKQDEHRARPLLVDGITDLTIPAQPIDLTQWHETAPDGALIVVDEVQRIWRPRGPGAKPGPDIQALETHRHRGIDFYLITQGPALIDINVRALVGRHIHLRDLGIMGRMWYEWPECNLQCATGWRSAVVKKKYKPDKKAFALYKSASLHIKPVRSVPPVLLVFGGALALLVALVAYAYSTISARTSPAPAAAPAGSPAPAGAPGAPPARPLGVMASTRPAPDTDNAAAASPQIDDLILTGHVWPSHVLLQWVPGGQPRTTFTLAQPVTHGIHVRAVFMFSFPFSNRLVPPLDRRSVPGVPYPSAQAPAT